MSPVTYNEFMDCYDDVELIDCEVINEHKRKMVFKFSCGIIHFRRVTLFVDDFDYIHNLEAPGVIWGDLELSYDTSYEFSSEYWINGFMISSDRDGFESHASTLEAKLDKLGL